MKPAKYNNFRLLPK